MAALFFLDERVPHIVHATLELRERTVVVDDEISARAFELRGHLGRDHLHCFRLAKSPVFHQTLETNGTIGINEQDAVESFRHLALEQERNVADHDAIAARPSDFDELIAESPDLGMDDAVQLLELLRIAENHAAERHTVEVIVGCQYRGTPPGDDLVIRRCAKLDGSPGEHVGVDDSGAVLRKQLSDRGFSAADVPCESNQHHIGLVQGFLTKPASSAKVRGASGAVNDRVRLSSHGARARDRPVYTANGNKGGRVTKLTERGTVEELAESDEFQEIVRRQLELIGEDPDREGLVRTPRRVATSLAWLTRGYEMDVEHVVNGAVFDSEGASNMIMVRDIELYSLCEHHMLPFYGKAHVAYIPSGRIVGLSKLPRVVEVFARRLQIQERLTEQIASALDDVLQPQGVGVVIEAYHLCMMMRGVEKQNSKTITSAVRGLFRNDQRTREEFLTLAHG